MQREQVDVETLHRDILLLHAVEVLREDDREVPRRLANLLEDVLDNACLILQGAQRHDIRVKRFPSVLLACTAAAC